MGPQHRVVNITIQPNKRVERPGTSSASNERTAKCHKSLVLLRRNFWLIISFYLACIAYHNKAMLTPARVIDFIYEEIESINKDYRKDYCTLDFLKQKIYQKWEITRIRIHQQAVSFMK